MWRTFKRILIGIGGFVVLLIALLYFATMGLPEVADTFLQAAAAGKYDKAYSMLADEFRNTTTKEELAVFLKENRLDQYKEASWNERGIDQSSGMLTGSVKTESGEEIPLTVKFVKKDDEWKIFALVKPKEEVSEPGIVKETKKSEEGLSPINSVLQKIPLKEKTEQMVKETVHLFAAGIANKDMKILYMQTSQNFQQGFSLEDFNKTFSVYYDTGFDFMVLDQMTPVISKEPNLTEEGELEIEAYYATSLVRPYFSLKYVMQNGQWKLNAIFVEVKEVKRKGKMEENGFFSKNSLAKKIPPVSEIEQMVKKGVHLYAIGNANKNMKELYDEMTQLVKEQYTLDAFNKAFSVYYDSGLNFKILDRMSPVISEKPYINDIGEMEVKVYYATSSVRPYFTLKYLFQNGKWNLNSFTVMIKAIKPKNEADRKEKKDVSDTGSKPKPVNKDEYIELVQKTINTFVLSVREKSMEKMYAQMATAFREKIGLEKMNRFFEKFLTGQVDLSVVRTLPPVFEQMPKIDDNGVLKIEGYYDTSPSRLYFSFYYIQESGTWKLTGINVNLK